MTLECYHVPRMTGSADHPRCAHCSVIIGQAKCYACLGSGRRHGLGQRPVMCTICYGLGFRWVEMTTFIPTPGKRSEGEA